MKEIQCVGADGQTRNFSYRVDEVENGFDFLVSSIPPHPNGEFFQCTVSRIDDNMVQVVALFKNAECYGAKGIPDAIFPEIAAILQKKVVSSPEDGGAGIYRSPYATKCWERLKMKGMATYDALTDIYTLL